ncbi:phage shock protein operon transcriptional activator [Lichenicoccus sp.]|uniref:phage shock protein operon transcriptional activator n=1 Tax=Lichenicoccus sp. TaxID=2781899 RepID=UPI003D151D68
MARSANLSEDSATPLGEAPVFREMLAHVSQAAPLNRPVLVIGERGTGKELVASRLAFLSPRWERPFIKLNCAVLGEALLDSELFGHEAGAFTGATRRRPGRFELADGGTLFLDEVATASLAVQEKLLRVIEYGSFERVGGSDTQRVDVRVVAATNADLPAMAKAGTFRADLLDRLAFDVIAVPPLRARPDDIALLAGHFAIRMTRELGREMFAGFGPDAIAELRGYTWPGNVRELRNVVERSVYRLADPAKPVTRIVLDPFPAVPGSGNGISTDPIATPAADGTDFTARTRAFEESLLQAALASNRFNQRAASRALGLTYYQFRHHLKSHGLLRGPDSVKDPAV